MRRAYKKSHCYTGGVIHELFYNGHTPSKKNLLKFNGRTKKGYYDPETRAYLTEIDRQLGLQWALPALTHPALGVIFYVQTGRSDRDNKLATIMDGLVHAGVLVDDCIDSCNGELWLGPAFKCREAGLAGVRIFVEPTGDFDAMMRHIRSLDISDVTPIKMWASNMVKPSCGFRGRVKK